MAWYADLHVHSRFSRATSRDLDPEHLAISAALKGIAVVGTGDCIHPGWTAELKEKLEPDGTGLFRLKPDIAAETEKKLPPACRRPVRFMLTTEISTIYKKGDKTRKVHHVILMGEMATAERLAAALARIGNIASDGRPILGLDSRDLLETALAAGPDCFLVPAHIWTPWFAALGSKSGFDSIADCYGDLADRIFAVETGLSSDPAMNWRVSSLDRYRLVSNSDAHSPAKLGREATAFSCAPAFAAMRRALETGDGYDGTVEFFPEEGKYHLDGHRACNVRLTPKETLALGGLCPVCGKPVTVGVAHRVEMLADRAAAMPPATAGKVESFVPLPEIIGEILGCGPTSKGVTESYGRALDRLGPELSALGEVPLEDISRLDPLLAEAVGRLRSGKVIREGGYDGEYGRIRLFTDAERDRRTKGGFLFDAPLAPRKKRAPKAAAKPAAAEAEAKTAAPAPSGLSGVLAGLDPDQAAAAAYTGGPLMVIAGPGSGKTRMLTRRLAHLIDECGVRPERTLAVTFTRRATEEMKTRLAALLPGKTVPVHSFHSLGLAILRAEADAAGLPPDFRVASEAERRKALAAALAIAPGRAEKLIRAVSAAKRTGKAGDADTRLAAETLARLGREGGWIDFDDLVIRAGDLLESRPDAAARWRFDHVLADEFQDIDARQYRLLKLVAEGGVPTVVGDPDQAIYGFRGADETCFARFARDFPAARTLRLARNYRSSGAIVAAADALMGRTAAGIVRQKGEPVELFVAGTERGEARFVADTIAELMGGHDMLAAGEAKTADVLGFADFAVLTRTGAQSAAFAEAFDEAGIPYGKSTPDPIANRPAVAAMLAALAGKTGDPARLAAEAVEAVRRAGTLEAADIAEAAGWLATLAEAAADPDGLREAVLLATEADFLDPRAQRVNLLTMHAAKGLEFPVVFVVGLEDGLTPLRFPGEEDKTNEERRLFYVAATRAGDRLFLSRAKTRLRNGKAECLPPSPFLAAMGKTVRLRNEKPRRPTQLSLF